jgi:small subunit ribosomal protein S16
VLNNFALEVMRLAVRIRLQRFGRKHHPFYRVVVADSRTGRDGKFIEKLGHYNPLTEPAEITVNEERALYWLQVGAQPSDTVKSILSKMGIWARFMNQKQAREAKLVEEEFASDSLPSELLNSESEE